MLLGAKKRIRDACVSRPSVSESWAVSAPEGPSWGDLRMPAGVGSSDARLVPQGQVVTAIYVRRLCSQARQSVITGTNIPEIMRRGRDGAAWVRGCCGCFGSLHLVSLHAVTRHLRYCRNRSNPFMNKAFRGLQEWSGRRESNPYDQLGRLEFYH
jgi:hypothetical protein